MPSLPGLLDDNMQAVFRQFFLCLSTWPPWASIVLASGLVLLLCGTPQGFCALENVTRASNITVVSSERVNFQFWVNYPFSARLAASNILFVFAQVSLTPSLALSLCLPLLPPPLLIFLCLHTLRVFFFFLTLPFPSSPAVSSNSASTPSPPQSGTQLSEMAVNRIALTRVEFWMRGASLQSWLLTIGKQLL